MEGSGYFSLPLFQRSRYAAFASQVVFDFIGTGPAIGGILPKLCGNIRSILAGAGAIIEAILLGKNNDTAVSFSAVVVPTFNA